MSRSALAFALDAVTQYGEPVASCGDHVRVRLSQQELARRHQCAPSTVSWYLHRLGPAVVTRRKGLVFDRAALARLGTDRRPLGPRTVAVEQELLDAFARPSPDGTPAEFLTSPTTARAASLQDVAAHLGMNRSSAHRHVSALEHAGHLRRRGRRLYPVGADTTTKELPVDDDPPPAVPAPTGPVTAPQLLQLLDKVADVMGMVAAIVGQLLDADQPADDTTPGFSGAHNPRSFGAQSADGPEVRAAAAADHGRGSSTACDLIDKSDVEITSNQSSSGAADSRPRTELRAEEPRIGAGPDWTAQQLPALLAPLLEECDRAKLPGVADPQRVIASLRPYTAEQVTAAARQMAADLRSGAPMRSPVAILVRKADAADPYYFRPVPAPPPPVPPPVIVQDEDPVDDEAVAAVADLDADALAALDHEVQAHVHRLLGPELGANALAAAETLAYWRPIVWRNGQAPAATAEEQR